MLRASIIIVFLLLNHHLFGQETNTVSISYFAPYGVQFGTKISASFKLKNWENNTKNDKSSTTILSADPQISYFIFPNVQHNVWLNNEFVFSRHKPSKRFYPMASIGAGYLISIQNIYGSVNLATGDITRNSESLHYFLPTFNLGFGITPKKNIGFYFKAFYGRKMLTKAEVAAFFGADLGLLLNLSKKTQ